MGEPPMPLSLQIDLQRAAETFLNQSIFRRAPHNFKLGIGSRVERAFDLLVTHFAMNRLDHAGVTAVQTVGNPQQRGAGIDHTLTMLATNYGTAYVKKSGSICGDSARCSR